MSWAVSASSMNYTVPSKLSPLILDFKLIYVMTIKDEPIICSLLINTIRVISKWKIFIISVRGGIVKYCCGWGSFGENDLVDFKVDDFGISIALAKKIINGLAFSVKWRVGHSEITEEVSVFSIWLYSDLRVSNYEIELIINCRLFSPLQFIALVFGQRKNETWFLKRGFVVYSLIKSSNYYFLCFSNHK